MSCSTPELRTPTEIVQELCSMIGSNLSSSQALTALNRAISSWGSRIKNCFCMEYPCGIWCGACEVPLHCCGVDDIEVYIRSGCTCGGCWRPLVCYRVECGKLMLDGEVEGYLMIKYHVPNSQIPKRGLVTSELFDPDDGVLWLEGRVDNLAPAGYVRVCDQWFQYSCWEQVRIDADGGFDMEQSSAWIDAQVGHDVRQGPAARPYPDAQAGIEIQNAGCGVHTLLRDVKPVCNTDALPDILGTGLPVEIGIGAPDGMAFDLLYNLAAMYAYQAQMNGCNSDSERSIAFEMMRFYKELADEGWQQRPLYRKPRVNIFGSMDHRYKRAGRHTGAYMASRNANAYPRRIRAKVTG